MRYISTRGSAPAHDFEGVTLAGLARDGGLYLPETWPQMARDEIAALAGKSFAEIAVDARVCVDATRACGYRGARAVNRCG